MKYILTPQPREICLSGQKLPIGAVRGDFMQCQETFCQYLSAFYNARPNGTGAIITVKANEALQAESYEISCGNNEIIISASDSRGVHHAFATLLQLSEENDGRIYISGAEIKDAPHCPYRGLMIDVARCEHSIDFLYDYIDICYYFKLASLQIHFTEDKAFTLPIGPFSKLNDKYFYTKQQLKALSQYAFERGITLIPEMDVPGHSLSFMRNYPEIFGTGSVLPADERVFDALEACFKEIAELFSYSPYIHIGGDEAKIDGWESCEKTQRYCRLHNIHSLQHLYAHYVQRCAKMILGLGRVPIVWEGFKEEYNYLIPRETLVISWENYYQTAYRLAQAGFTLINCSWKPLYIVSPSISWSAKEILKWDTHQWGHKWECSAAYNGLKIDGRYKVLGGQMCAWGDILADYEDSLKGCMEEYELVCGRIGALAERTWNAEEITDEEEWERTQLRHMRALKQALRRAQN